MVGFTTLRGEEFFCVVAAVQVDEGAQIRHQGNQCGEKEGPEVQCLEHVQEGQLVQRAWNSGMQSRDSPAQSDMGQDSGVREVHVPSRSR